MDRSIFILTSRTGIVIQQELIESQNECFGYVYVPIYLAGLSAELPNRVMLQWDII
jgi:hypothetical protein